MGALTPAKAREMAKDLLDPGTAKERIDRVTGDLVEWSQRNSERVREMVRREIADQLRRAGLAPQSEVDALKKRVAALERAAAPVKTAAKKPTAKKTAARGSSSGGAGA